MTEGTPIRVEIERKSAEVLNNTDWQTEQTFTSSEPVFIHGFFDGNLRGQLNGHLIIERKIEGADFREKIRYVRLNDVGVHQINGQIKRKGLGSLLVKELEKMAQQFGAEKIVGTISGKDLEEQPWLPKFYTQLGFTVTQTTTGFSLEKNLLSNAIKS